MEAHIPNEIRNLRSFNAALENSEKNLSADYDSKKKGFINVIKNFLGRLIPSYYKKRKESNPSHGELQKLLDAKKVANEEKELDEEFAKVVVWKPEKSSVSAEEEPGLLKPLEEEPVLRVPKAVRKKTSKKNSEDKEAENPFLDKLKSLNAVAKKKTAKTPTQHLSAKMKALKESLSLILAISKEIQKTNTLLRATKKNKISAERKQIEKKLTERKASLLETKQKADQVREILQKQVAEIAKGKK